MRGAWIGVAQACMMLLCSTVMHVHLLHPVRACDQIIAHMYRCDLLFALVTKACLLPTRMSLGCSQRLIGHSEVRGALNNYLNSVKSFVLVMKACLLLTQTLPGYFRHLTSDRSMTSMTGESNLAFF